ncbi:MAG TPA: DUF1566 domain-containing protein [Prolixibacteraceae bacterium]|nr:DUF1566 domain-containing protein [Prolixibacteraceae bacterium]
MKKNFILLFALLIVASIFAQSPEKMSYQAVIRNSNNQLIINKTVGMKTSILQGTVSGDLVYEEIYHPNPTTNANGLVTVEIGSGIPVFGSFSAINWSAGPYFIKTETDPAGGTNYTISGTNQLLSVPFALHAKTADKIKGTGSHYVGELYGGGVVFWVDHTGLHGLICSMIDIEENHIWSNVLKKEIGTAAQSDWNGLGNSNAIVGQNGHYMSAAKICLDYTNADYGTGSFSDWYLPSITELNHVWNNFYEVQKALTNDGNASTTPFRKYYYWSSTEYNFETSWYFIMGDGFADTKENNYANSVRAVRAF